MEKLRETIEDAGKNGTNKCAYRKLRRLGAENTEKQDFVWPAVDDEEITHQEKANQIAAHFTAISSELEPLVIEDLPPYVKEALHHESSGPTFSEYELYI